MCGCVAVWLWAANAAAAVYLCRVAGNNNVQANVVVVSPLYWVSWLRELKRGSGDGWSLAVVANCILHPGRLGECIARRIERKQRRNEAATFLEQTFRSTCIHTTCGKARGFFLLFFLCSTESCAPRLQYCIRRIAGCMCVPIRKPTRQSSGSVSRL